MTENEENEENINVSSMEEYLQMCMAAITQHGYTVQGIFDNTGFLPNWTYTVGLERGGLPEYLIVGLPNETAKAVLHALVRRCSSSFQKWPMHGDVVHHFPRQDQSMACIAVDDEVARSGAWFNIGFHLRGSKENFRVVQLVWPDENGKWPKDSPKQILLGKPWWNEQGVYDQDGNV